MEALVGEAFSRLDPLAQQVMQALAIYPVPVPPVAVDYLLQPYQPAIDAAPVLGRLVNMQFVRREAGRYYLHQVDRDYALAACPAGEPADRDADPPPFTRQALRHRGADYFEQTRTPREDWKSLDDLAPQLAEFELRYQGGDYDTAAQVLLGIDFDYLIQWGHYRLTVELHERLQGHLDDPWTNAASKTNLGECYRSLGQFTRAIDLYEQALAIARETGDRRRRGHRPGQPRQLLRRARPDPPGHRPVRAGAGHRPGDRRPARARPPSWATSATATPSSARSPGPSTCTSRRWPSPGRPATGRARPADLGNLGNCYADLGQIARAIDLYEQALAIARQIGYRYAEAAVPRQPRGGIRRPGVVGPGRQVQPAGHRHRRRHRQRAGAKRGPSRPGADPAARRGPGRRPAGHQRRPRPRLPDPTGRTCHCCPGSSGSGRTSRRQPPGVPGCHHPGRGSSWSRPAATTRRWTPRHWRCAGSR